MKKLHLTAVAFALVTGSALAESGLGLDRSTAKPLLQQSTQQGVASTNDQAVTTQERQRPRVLPSVKLQGDTYRSFGRR